MPRGQRLILLALLGAALQAQSNRDRMLVSTQWLAANLDQPGLVILHVGTAKDYQAGHVPGARLLSLADISLPAAEGSLRLELPPLEKLETALGRVGVTASSRIIVYPANESVQSAARVWFTLDYAGLGGRASLLDGGLIRWKAEGRPLSTETSAFQPTAPKLSPEKGLVVDAGWLAARLNDPELDILDARAQEYYSGATAGPMPRAGRIPKAVNVPYNSLLDAQFRFLSDDEIRARIPQGKLKVAYCHIGLQATVVYFAARLLGGDVKLYDGSFEDWSRRPDLPVAADGR